MNRRIDPGFDALNNDEQIDALVDVLEGGLPPLYRLPDYFQSFIEDPDVAEDVSIYLLPLFQIGNGKMPPILSMLLHERYRGTLHGRIVYCASSGNTAANGALLAPAFGIVQFVAVVDETISKGKRDQLELAGAKIEHPPEGMSTIEYAEMCGVQPGCFALNQYRHRGSVDSHKRWTWPHVVREMKRLGKIPSMVSLALGTTSSFVAAECLKEDWPNLNLIGVACVSEEEKIPGARTKNGLKVTEFCYEEVLNRQNLGYDPLVFCGKYDAYFMSRELYRHSSCWAGPTTGMSIAADLQLINRRYRVGGSKAIEGFRNGVGEIVIVGLAMDQAVVYGPEYTEILGS